MKKIISFLAIMLIGLMALAQTTHRVSYGESDPVWISDSTDYIHRNDTTTKVASRKWVTDKAYVTATYTGDLTITGDITGDTAKFTHYGGKSPFTVGDAGFNLEYNNDWFTYGVPGLMISSKNDFGYNMNGVMDFSITGLDTLLIFAWIRNDFSEGYNIALDSNRIEIGSNPQMAGVANINIGDATNYDDIVNIYGTYGGTVIIDPNLENVAMGAWSLYSNTEGESNVAMGSGSLKYNTEGVGNVAVGYQNLYFNTTGYHNTAMGTESLFSNTEGESNVAMGYRSGYSNTEGGNNIFIGDSAGYNATGSYKLYIDESPTAAPLIYGDFENNLLTINGDMTVTGKVAASDSICIARFRWASKGTIPNDTLVLIRGVNDTIEWHPPRAP